MQIELVEAEKKINETDVSWFIVIAVWLYIVIHTIKLTTIRVESFFSKIFLNEARELGL